MNPKPYKTTDARPTPGTMIKPGELIDVVETKPLTLADRRIYNLLVENAWDKIAEPIEHVISKTDLRKSSEETDRIEDTIKRLMTTLVVRFNPKDGKFYEEFVQLLGPSKVNRAYNGEVRYNFSPELRALLCESTIFARLRSEVMFALTSKYAFCLYEMVQKRGNLEHIWSEDFTLEQIRALLGVPAGKLERFANLNAWALKPAVAEVCALADFGVRLDPIKEGRTVTGVRMSWWRKSPDELRAAFNELKRAKVGRKARITGTVEQIEELTALSSLSPKPNPKPARRVSRRV